MTRWLFIAAGILATLTGLLAASHARDDGLYVHGLLFAAFGIGLIFWLVGNWPLERTEPGDR